MRTEVVPLAAVGTEQYRAFLETCPDSMIYATPEWMSFVEAVTGCDPINVIVTHRHGAIVGALPLAVKRSGQLTIANGLPYFGSHGDVLLAEDDREALEAVGQALSGALAEIDVAAVNFVSHPLRPRLATVAHVAGLDPWDRRTGQISTLPRATTNEGALEAVLSACHQKTRNLVRKGLKGDFVIRRSTAERDWASMADHHRLGLERIGGRYKTAEQFEALRDALQAKGMCRLYVAERQGQFAGALLLLRYRDWVEYFTPVAVEAFRSEQVLSALIAHGMVESISEGAKYWNWGGTWLTQSGVYHFKRGWGASDYPYTYFGRSDDEKLDGKDMSELLARFPFFYVRPN